MSTLTSWMLLPPCCPRPASELVLLLPLFPCFVVLRFVAVPPVASAPLFVGRFGGASGCLAPGFAFCPLLVCFPFLPCSAPGCCFLFCLHSYVIFWRVFHSMLRPAAPALCRVGWGGPGTAWSLRVRGAFIATTALLFVLGPYGVVLRPNLHVHVLRPRGPVSIT